MGSNKCTLDWFDYKNGYYCKNIYAQCNPDVVQELGDVGNDICAYGGKLYAVINCSNIVEIMDAKTARHLSQVPIPNGRFLAFAGRYAYVSSYAGPVEMDPNARRGYVARIDTASFQVIDTCTVGYQPEQMAVYDGKLYVANSGGYRVPNYDYTVSVIDLNSFRVIKTLDVAPNLQYMELDEKRGCLYVSSRGDYYDIPSAIYVINCNTDDIVDELAIPCTAMTLRGDSLYIISRNLSWFNLDESVNYTIFDLEQREVVTHNFITDGSDANITNPYALAVNPENGDILVSDARDYVTPGRLFYYSPNGTLRWSVFTGDIPGHIAFLEN